MVRRMLAVVAAKDSAFRGEGDWISFLAFREALQAERLYSQGHRSVNTDCRGNRRSFPTRLLADGSKHACPAQGSVIRSELPAADEIVRSGMPWPWRRLLGSLSVAPRGWARPRLLLFDFVGVTLQDNNVADFGHYSGYRIIVPLHMYIAILICGAHRSEHAGLRPHSLIRTARKPDTVNHADLSHLAPTLHDLMAARTRTGFNPATRTGEIQARRSLIPTFAPSRWGSRQRAVGYPTG